MTDKEFSINKQNNYSNNKNQDVNSNLKPIYSLDYIPFDR